KLFPRAENVVVCPAEPRGPLLQAACLAGALRAPLFVTHDKPEEADELRQYLAGWQAGRVYAVGSAGAILQKWPVEQVIRPGGGEERYVAGGGGGRWPRAI